LQIVVGGIVGPNGVEVKTAVATCPAWKQVIGGGHLVAAGGNEHRIAVYASYPSAAATWTAIARETGSSPTCSIQAYALCATV
jgi:hypothetical protein